MKYRIMTMIVFISFLCFACTNDLPESQQVIETEESAAAKDNTAGIEKDVTFNPASYTFPPDDEEFKWALEEAGMMDNWYTEVWPRRSEPDEYGANHMFNNSSGLVHAAVNARRNERINGADDEYSLLISLVINTQNQDTPLEDYNNFEQEELPKIWMLAGNLILAQEEVEQLREQCMTFFDEYTLPAGELDVSWKGRQGNVQCIVTYTWHHILQKHVFYSLDLDTAGVFDTLSFSQAYMSTIGKFPFERSTVLATDILAIAEEAGETGYVLRRMKGHIEQLEPNSDALEGIPDADQYQKGLLVDETGSMTVYLAPTTLTESELKDELIHFAIIVNAPEPYCKIVLSAPDYYDF